MVSTKPKTRYFNPTKEETEEISKDPYVMDLVNRTQAFAYTHCLSKNIFAWREFIHDLQVDLALHIYDYEIAYRKGLHGKTGFGAYCTAAKQLAINWSAYYQTHKRRLNFESVSIEASMEREDRAPIQISSDDTSMEEIELLASIEQSFGRTAKELCFQLLRGETLSKADLNKLREIPNLKDFLQG